MTACRQCWALAEAASQTALFCCVPAWQPGAACSLVRAVVKHFTVPLASHQNSSPPCCPVFADPADKWRRLAAVNSGMLRRHFQASVRGVPCCGGATCFSLRPTGTAACGDVLAACTACPANGPSCPAICATCNTHRLPSLPPQELTKAVLFPLLPYLSPTLPPGPQAGQRADPKGELRAGLWRCKLPHWPAGALQASGLSSHPSNPLAHQPSSTPTVCPVPSCSGRGVSAAAAAATGGPGRTARSAGWTGCCAARDPA